MTGADFCNAAFAVYVPLGLYSARLRAMGRLLRAAVADMHYDVCRLWYGVERKKTEGVRE